jgi:hypothetical protein
MDIKNYDDFGGVEHLKYCFEVCSCHFIFMLFKAGELVSFVLSVCMPRILISFFYQVGLGFHFQNQLPENAIFWLNFHLVWRVPLYICFYGLILSSKSIGYLVLG